MTMRRTQLPLTDEQLDVLLRALGIQKRAGKWTVGGWRNYFSTDAGSNDYLICHHLEVSDWMRSRKIIRIKIYHVTEPAIAALRLAGWKIESNDISF